MEMKTYLIPGAPGAGTFEAQALAACYSVSASLNTRRAYWADFNHWIYFCHRRSVDPSRPEEIAVIAWLEEQKQSGHASKTRVRRISALSSIYQRLVRNQVIAKNPFSLEYGPTREKAQPANPTPTASATQVRAILATCSSVGLNDIRDEAIIRIFWSTGIRRQSLCAMCWEHLERELDSDFIANLPAKGSKIVRVLIRGRAGQALLRWLGSLRTAGIVKGAIWRNQRGVVLREKQIWTMLQERCKRAQVPPLHPHSFRVSFLTLNPASLEAKQDAAGHADPATTRLYDRSWRGRSAFELMPEVEDVT